MRRSSGMIPSATMDLYAPGMGQRSAAPGLDSKPQKAKSFFFAEDEQQADTGGHAWMAEGGPHEDDLPGMADPDDWDEPRSREQQQPPSQQQRQARPAKSAGRRRPSSSGRAQPRPQSAPMLASASGSFGGSNGSGRMGASQFSQRSSAAIVEVPSNAVSQREAVRQGTQRLAMHRLKKQQTEKRRVQDLQDYARQQRRQLVASIRLANDCSRILKRPVTYGISDDPTKKGMFDLETPSTLQMRVIVRQQGPSQYGWKAQGEAHYREISVPLFQKELEGLQREAAYEEQRKRESNQMIVNPEKSAPSQPRGGGGGGGVSAEMSNGSNVSRWQPQESEEELREFIHATVELASTLLEQSATLKKKAGPSKSFSPYT